MANNTKIVTRTAHKVIIRIGDTTKVFTDTELDTFLKLIHKLEAYDRKEE